VPRISWRWLCRSDVSCFSSGFEWPEYGCRALDSQ
jgi:hypothetical protein